MTVAAVVPPPPPVETTQNNPPAFDPKGPNIWETQTKDTPAGTVTPVPPPAPVDTQKQLSDYISGIQLPELKVSPEDLQKMISTGDMTGLQTSVQGMMRSAIQRVLTDSSRMVNNAMETLRGEFSGAADARVNAHDTRRELQEAVPAAKDPQFKPVIEGVFSRMLAMHGNDRAKALTATKEYWSVFRTMPGSEFGIDDRSPPRGGPSGSRGGRPDVDTDDAMIDWMAIGRGQ